MEIYVRSKESVGHFIIQHPYSCLSELTIDPMGQSYLSLSLYFSLSEGIFVFFQDHMSLCHGRYRSPKINQSPMMFKTIFPHRNTIILGISINKILRRKLWMLLFRPIPSPSLALFVSTSLDISFSFSLSLFYMTLSLSLSLSLSVSLSLSLSLFVARSFAGFYPPLPFLTF